MFVHISRRRKDPIFLYRRQNLPREIYTVFLPAHSWADRTPLGARVFSYTPCVLFPWMVCNCQRARVLLSLFPSHRHKSRLAYEKTAFEAAQNLPTRFLYPLGEKISTHKHVVTIVQETQKPSSILYSTPPAFGWGCAVLSPHHFKRGILFSLCGDFLHSLYSI